MDLLWEKFAEGLGTIGPVGIFGLVAWIAWLKYGRPPLPLGSSTKTTTTETRPAIVTCMQDEIVQGVHASGEQQRHDIRATLEAVERIEHRQEAFNATQATTAACLERIVDGLGRLEGRLNPPIAAPAPRRRTRAAR